MKGIILYLLTMISLNSLAQDARSERAILFFRQVANEVLTDELKDVLKKGQITTSEIELVDNTGSIVDAIGVPGKIILATENWLKFLREGRDVRILVLHEVLRMAGVNDDNYLVSRKIIKFEPKEEFSRAYCNLRVATTEKIQKTKKMKGVGYGEPPTGGIFIFGTSSQKEAHNNAILDLEENCKKKGYSDGFKIIDGYSEISNNNSNGYFKSVNKVVLNGLCIKNEITKRSQKLQKKEACEKVNLCTDLVHGGIIKELSLEDEIELSETSKKWSCL